MRFAYAYTEKGHGDYAGSEQPRSVDGKGPKAGHLLTRRYFSLLLPFNFFLYFFFLPAGLCYDTGPRGSFSRLLLSCLCQCRRPQQGKMKSTLVTRRPSLGVLS